MGFIENREETTISVAKKKKGISKGQIIAIACILVIVGLTILVTSGIGNKNTLSGSWTFSRYEDDSRQWNEYYKGIMIDRYYNTTIGTIHFRKDGTFIAECYDVDDYYGRYPDAEEKKIIGEYECDGDTLTLTWGSFDEISFEFEKRGSDLILANDSYGCYYYEKE